MKNHNWAKPRTRFSVEAYALRLFKALNTPKSLAAFMLLEAKEYDQLVDLSVSPLDYASESDFFKDYQVVKLLSKFPNFDLSVNPRVEAMKKFIEAEDQCRRTNEFIFGGFLTDKHSKNVHSVFHRAKRKIATILGPVPAYSDLDFRFGPGAAYGVRKATSVYNKVTSSLECTFAMLPALETFLGEFPNWTTDVDSMDSDHHEVELVHGSELTFVPKTAKTDRPICIEPLLNGLMQKGFGSYMRNRLSRFGVTLNDQSVNQKLAALAYTEGLSTIDFSSASDTISYGLVLELLPIDWFEALDISRCPQYCIEGNWYNFHKFTSMGNAYTFELESLIFYALAVSVCEELKIPYFTGVNLAVYGDDVIIPRDAVDLFSEVSSLAGFSINAEKSFFTGSFFESCGEDYFKGLLVRPFFIKRNVSTIEDHFYVTNKTLEVIAKLEGLPSFYQSSDYRRVHVALHELHAWCISCVPRKLRLLGPSGSGDGCLAADFDVCVPPRHRCWDGYVYRQVGRRAIMTRFKPSDFVPMIYALYHAGSTTPRRLDAIPEPSDNGSGYTLRNRSAPFIGKVFHFGHWPSCPTTWSDRAISLCKQKT